MNFALVLKAQKQATGLVFAILSSVMSKPSLNVVKLTPIWFIFSSCVLAAAIFFIIQSITVFGAPVRPGLDFTGGSKIEYRFSGAELKAAAKTLGSEQVQNILKSIGLGGSQVMITKDADPILILRTRAISDDPVADKLAEALKAEYGNFEIKSIDTVSPVIGPELFRSGVTALLITIIAIVLYISSRFRKDYAVSGIVALVHDVTIVTGLFAYLGLYKGLEVDMLFITALLTTFGFSIHDTIVVFDRIRENQKLQTKSFDFAAVADHSIDQVVVRSLNTSFSVLIVLAILYFLGGESTRIFSAAMFAGLLVGAYSSIFIASPLLVIFRKNNILQ